MLGPLFIIILVFANYCRKHDTDIFQRKNFFLLLIFTAIPMVCGFFFLLLNGCSEPWAYPVLGVSLNLYFVFQAASFYYVLIFIDYTVGRSVPRTRKLIIAVWVIIAVYMISLGANFRRGFYFTVSRPDNLYHQGRFFIIPAAVSGLALVLGLLEALVLSIRRRGLFRGRRFTLTVTLLLGIPGALDLFFNTVSLLWVGFSAALLCAYFFIISIDLRSDALTGAGNRFAFNEFLEKLNRQTKKDTWSLIMLDMDGLKKINDTLGHVTGDQALCDMASIIAAAAGVNDFTARYGGDEFIIVTQTDPAALMSRIKGAMGDLNQGGTRPYKIHMSYGCDSFTTGSDLDLDDFLRHVDSLMYKQKRVKIERRRVVEEGAEEDLCRPTT
ncbi:MAG: GGDEF domain-containing protein, partial [Spirochaetaceae bacterium]|jgi:diguanylate cyclase (GGDEF)-like protein|nr:GGDEF domain-containing protein [Spirochaetaceae bacterium]